MSYKETAREARLKVLDLIYEAQTSHIGSNLSCIDILTVLFSKVDFEKDKFILSAGWKAASLYFFLWKAGKITLEQLDSYCKEDSKFIGLAEPIIPEIPFSGGSMGLGFPAAVGFALAKKLKNEDGTVYCLMSDGELNSGTTWEGALIAAKYKLDNLVVFVDSNGLQAMGAVQDVLPAGFPTSGWNAHAIDGHDFSMIERAITLSAKSFMPNVFIAKTIKGKGWKRAENNNLYHYKAPSEDEYNEAKLCLKL